MKAPSSENFYYLSIIKYVGRTRTQSSDFLKYLWIFAFLALNLSYFYVTWRDFSILCFCMLESSFIRSLILPVWVIRVYFLFYFLIGFFFAKFAIHFFPAYYRIQSQSICELWDIFYLLPSIQIKGFYVFGPIGNLNLLLLFVVSYRK